MKMEDLCRQMSFMLDAGVGLRVVMTVLTETSSKRKSDNKQHKALRSTLEGIMRGESLSRALEEANYFPDFMCNMCRIGELGDNLPKVMSLLADYYEETAKNRSEIKSALIYPAIVASMMLIMIVVAVLYVLPNYAMMFEATDIQLPTLTLVLLGISSVIMTRWWLVLPIVFLIIMVPITVVRTETGRHWYEFVLLQIPVYRQMVSLNIVQALSLLLQSGQPLSDGMLAVSGVIPNKRVAHDILMISAGLQEGASFWSLLAEVPYIDHVIVSMARVGDETGNMALIFEHASYYSQYRFKEMSKRLNKTVEPVVILVLGLILGLVMLSIILPTFAMTEFV